MFLLLWASIKRPLTALSFVIIVTGLVRLGVYIKNRKHKTKRQRKRFMAMTIVTIACIVALSNIAVASEPQSDGSFFRTLIGKWKKNRADKKANKDKEAHENAKKKQEAEELKRRQEAEEKSKKEQEQKEIEAAATQNQVQQQNAVPPVQDEPSTVFFNNCKEARAAGYSRMQRGTPGYREELDRDGDGIACERTR